MSASSQSLRFIEFENELKFYNLGAGLRMNANNESMQVQSNPSTGLEANARKRRYAGADADRIHIKNNVYPSRQFGGYKFSFVGCLVLYSDHRQQ